MSKLLDEDVILERWHRMREQNPTISVSDGADALAPCIAPGYAFRLAKSRRLLRGAQARHDHFMIKAGQRAAVTEILLRDLARERHPSNRRPTGESAAADGGVA